MNLDRLRLLRELADRGTVGAAAAALSLTPSAASQQLKNLQREVGVALLEPAGRKVRLTAAGHALVARADEVLAALDRAQAEMDTYRVSPRGTVRVSMFPSGAAMLLPALITGATAAGIDVLARDIDLPAASAPAQLADFDIVVVHRDERDTEEWSARFESTFLLREPLEIVLPPGHRLADHSHVPLHELAEDPWISVELGLMVDDVLRSLATITGVNPRIVQRINDFRVLEELVGAGVGVGLLPRYVATTRSELIRKPISGIHVARRLEAVTRTGATMRSAIGVIIDLLVRTAQDIDRSSGARHR